MADLAICINSNFSGDELILGEYYLINNFVDIHLSLLVTVRYVSAEHLLRDNFSIASMEEYAAVESLYAKLQPLKFKFAASRFELITKPARFAEALARAEERRKLGEK